MISKHTFSLSVVLSGLTIGTVSAKDTRPNILCIFTDDQSYRTVSRYPGAYKFANTPNIDGLAQNGIRFDNAYIGAKCVPSRASFLTGRLQFNVGGKEQKRYWFQDLKQGGYYTAMIGKWHWGKGAEMHQHGNAWDWSVVWDHGQKHEHKTYYYNQSVNVNGGEPEKLGSYSTDRYTDYTLKFLEDREKEPGKPWFYWLCYGGVHGPYTPAKRHKGMLKDAEKTKIPVDVFGPRPGKPKHMQTFSKWKKGKDGKPSFKNQSLDFWVKQYTEAVAAIDDGVGEIVKKLRDTGQLENTIIIFTSDQGFAWGQHGLRDKKHPYDAAIRCPLIVSYPKAYPVDKVCMAPVNGVDLIRTFHSLAGITPKVKLDGRDMSQLFKSPRETTEWNKTPMMQVYTNNLYDTEEISEAIKEKNWSKFIVEKNQKSKVWFMIHDGRYKYVRYCYPDTLEELYDLTKDSDELINLAVSIEYQTKLKAMRKLMIDQLLEKGCPV